MVRMIEKTGFGIPKALILALWSTWCLAGGAGAVDRYELETPAFVMAGDPDVALHVKPFRAEGGAVGQTVKFVGLPAGVRVEPWDPSGGWTVAEPTQWRLFVSPSVTDRRLFLKVQNTDDAKIFGTGVVNLEKPVDHFSFTPLGMAAPRAGTAFRFQVLALDKDGAVVSSFNDSVTLSASVGEVQPAQISGDLFVKGAARVDVIFSLGDSVQPNRLEAQAVLLYEGQIQKASGAVALTVLPEGQP